jgi:small subunit ribosomal protein S20
MRQARSRNEQNRVARSTLRTAIKRVRNAPAESAEAAYLEAVRLLDRAGRKRLIHPNAAARSKRRLRKVVAGKS